MGPVELTVSDELSACQHTYKTGWQTNKPKTNFGPKFDWTLDLYQDELHLSGG